MSPNGDVWERHIAAAQERVLSQGFDNATDRDVQIAMFGYLSHSLKACLSGGTDWQAKAKQVSVPAIAGGGLAAIILKVLELFSR